MSSPNDIKLEVRLREAIRQRHYSIKTEDVYVMWYKQFVRFHGLRHPDEMGKMRLRKVCRDKISNKPKHS